MKSICLLVAVLLIGNIKTRIAMAQTQLPTTNLPGFREVLKVISSGGLPGEGGLAIGLLNGIQGNAQHSILQGLQEGFLEFPGNLLSPKKDFDALKRECLAHSNQNVSDEVEQASNDIQKCVLGLLPNVMSLLGEDSVNLCNSLHNSLHKCIVDFTKKLELCMDETSAYIPAYNVGVFDSIFKFLCVGEADNLISLLMSLLQPNGCVHKSQEISRECLSKTMNFTSTASAVFRNITKPELCRDTAIWKDCVNENAKKVCSDDMYELATGITKAIYGPCSESTSFLANTLLLVLLFVFRELL